MDASQRIRDKVDRVGETFPSQHERLSRCAEVVIERGADPLHKAFEKQLDQISNMKSEEKAAQTVDKVEHTIFESNIMSPFLGAHESKGHMRFWIAVLIGILCVAALIVATVPSLIRLF